MRTLSGYHGIYTINEHAAQRIEQRFGVAGAAEQSLWLVRMICEAERLYCELLAPYLNAPRILWCCADDVRIVTDGNEVVTAWRQGVPDSEGEEKEEATA